MTKRFRSGGHTVRAVEDITFDAHPGDAISIIGPNGAGKSTLLRLIAGVHVPTTGTIRRRARCSALLELGAGFHDDLTGRENLDLTLAMSGLSRRERLRRMPDALDFAGLGDAVDLAAKHLSNGMIGRLACAAALHSDPELLIVDEALAVGDSAFQREMLAGVAALRERGTALLLVTHSPELAAAATTRTLWLHRGGLVEDGPTPEVLTRYEAAVRGWGRSFSPPRISIERMRLVPDHIEPSQPITVVLDAICTAETGPLELRVDIYPIVGDDTIWMRSPDETLETRQLNLVATTTPERVPSLSPGRHRITVDIASMPISRTKVELSAVLADADQLIIDEVSATLAIGDAVLRPHFHLRAEVLEASERP